MAGDLADLEREAGQLEPLAVVDAVRSAGGLVSGIPNGALRLASGSLSSGARSGR